VVNPKPMPLLTFIEIDQVLNWCHDLFEFCAEYYAISSHVTRIFVFTEFTDYTSAYHFFHPFHASALHLFDITF
jgi:hypothetical protein